MSIFVFLGPSLPVAEARSILDAVYLPPVSMGDVYSLCAVAPDAIVIIDGLFEQVPAVYHKEVLHALSSGVPVYGASSMGALRAAELHPFGMIGVGDIFEAFRSGELVDDDEVAVAHATADEGYRPVSEAMVNLRFGLRNALKDGVITGEQHDALVRAAKELYYPDRSWPALRDAAREIGIEEPALQQLLGYRHSSNLKRLDAIRCLEQVKVHSENWDSSRASEPNFVFEETVFWRRLVADMDRSLSRAENKAPEGDAVAQEAVRNHVLASARDRRDLLRFTLLDVLTKAEVKRLGLRVQPSEVQAAADAFRRRNDLATARAMSQWLSDNRLTLAEFAEMMQLEAEQHALLQHYGTVLHKPLIQFLKRTGRYARAAEAVIRRTEQLARTGVAQPTLETAGVDEASLFAWYQRTFGNAGVGLSEHAKELGFEAPIDLLSEVVSLYLTHKEGGAALQEANR
jgi:hypothetical protein